MEHDVLLEMKNISKEFPGVKALDNVSLTVRRGTVHALMGENGAGKSTLMKCLFGMYVKDGGSISLEGKEINFKNSKEAKRQSNVSFARRIRGRARSGGSVEYHEGRRFHCTIRNPQARPSSASLTH